MLLTLDPDQQETLYQKNRARMMFYNSASWSAGDFIAKQKTTKKKKKKKKKKKTKKKKRVSIMLDNTESWSAGYFIPYESAEMDEQDII